MLDRRDFDEWFAREQARSSTPLDATAKHWAEAGFTAAGRLMSQALRTQKHIERKTTEHAKRARLLQGANHG